MILNSLDVISWWTALLKIMNSLLMTIFLQTFKEQIGLELSEPRQAELALYCVAAKPFP